MYIKLVQVTTNGGNGEDCKAEMERKRVKPMERKMGKMRRDDVRPWRNWHVKFSEKRKEKKEIDMWNHLSHHLVEIHWQQKQKLCGIKEIC